jgi:hypothetical protein
MIRLKKLERPRRWAQIFRYSQEIRTRTAVKREYLQWRSERGIPYKCEQPGSPLQGQSKWREETLNLIMDHIDGNPRNNNFDNLRLLCPNCNSQLDTHGGRNIGRVLENYQDGYLLKDGEYKFFFEDSINLMTDSVSVLIGP